MSAGAIAVLIIGWAILIGGLAYFIWRAIKGKNKWMD